MINRTAEGIKTDMLEWARENIYGRMGEEWDYSGRDFDPLIHLLVGACASEVKNIYDAIDGSDRRVVKKLVELLVPEQAHLPTPAHALATALPTGSSAQLPATLQFRTDTEAGSFYFTPAFDCVILNSGLKVVGSDGLIFEYNPGQEKSSNQFSNVSKVLLGFESPKPITSFDNVLFYFNLLGQNNKLLFLHALSEAKWKINGLPVAINRGFRKVAEPVVNQVEPVSLLLRQVEERYQPYFFTTREFPGHAASKRNIGDVVVSWLRENHTSTPGLEKQAQELPMVADNFFWIEIQFPYPIRVFELEKNFRCASNIFPVLNRKLNVKDDADTFLNRPVLDVLRVSPEKPYVGVHKVENIQNKEVLQSLPLSQLKGSRRPSYSVRFGGVGRMDNFNAWNRYSYLLGLFREEHRYREVVERIGDKVSIEELHLLLGEKLLRDDQVPAAPENNVYFFLHPGESLKGGIRARIEYWTTDGAKANRTPVGRSLVCEPADPSLRKEGLTLVTAPSGGQDAPGEAEYFLLLQDTLLGSDKIVTADDVSRYCHRYLGASSLQKVHLQPGVRLEATPGAGISRVTEVQLQVENPEDPGWAGTCQELEYLLNEKTSSVIPFAVKLKEPR
ncbi:hypothetical protein BH24BAC1_BH24BAC1_10710 [soil metagenome]